MTTMNQITIPARVQLTVRCQFFVGGIECGKPAAWKWTHQKRKLGKRAWANPPKAEITHYCQEHGDDMMNEGRCKDSGMWEHLAANK